MDCGYKRKLDCLMDSMEVMVGDPFPSYVDRNHLEQNKRMRFAADFNGVCVDDLESSSSNQPSTSEDSWSHLKNSVEGSYNPDMDFDHDSKSINDFNQDDNTYEDLPSTSEVINSLRKVILWMSAQGDHNSDYIQYLGEVERYAMSKQLDIAQQRKITEYFLKQNRI